MTFCYLRALWRPQCHPPRHHGQRALAGVHGALHDLGTKADLNHCQSQLNANHLRLIWRQDELFGTEKLFIWRRLLFLALRAELLPEVLHADLEHT